MPPTDLPCADVESAADVGTLLAALLSDDVLAGRQVDGDGTDAGVAEDGDTANDSGAIADT
jgi:hypothetical protein